ncbi:MAG: hypothetical protein J6B08_00675 [Ruminiclostridium sp.]|nr:hypothetical protein [Ruminiclostridium sp.]
MLSSLNGMNNFYSSMSNVLTQWSDFRVSKNLYQAYFDMQKSENGSSSEESYIQKLINGSTEKLYEDKLGSLSQAVSESVEKLEKAFAIDEETDEIDYDAAYSAAESFINSYNDFVTNTGSSGDKTVSNKNTFIGNMTTAYTRRLEKAGVSIGSDGTLSINKEAFNSATASQLEQAFGKEDSFASCMGEQARQLEAYAQSDIYNRLNAYNQTGNVTNIVNMSGAFLNMLG